MSTFEVVRANRWPGRVRVAFFDHDGTVALFRTGWQGVMTDVMAASLSPLDGETEAERVAAATAIVHRTNGQSTLLQMQQLADLVAARGATPQPAATYKQIFVERMLEVSRPRIEAVRTGEAPAERWLVPGTLPLLRGLQARGIPCYLTSGTDHTLMREDVDVLGLPPYFAGVYGATADVENSTKEAVFSRLAREHHLGEGEFVVFGDGSEEIRLASEMGGIGIGLAHGGAAGGVVDPDQRERLIQAGADVIVADLCPYELILQYLFG